MLPASTTSTEPNLSLRPVEFDDIAIYFDWANDPEVRQNSMSPKPRAWTDHRCWFAARYDSPTCRMYVMCADGLRVGQVRFEENDGSWTISYSLDVSVRGQGLGKVLVGQAIAEFRKSIPAKIVATVKTFNVASLRILEGLNFVRGVGPTEEIAQFELV